MLRLTSVMAWMLQYYSGVRVVVGRSGEWSEQEEGGNEHGHAAAVGSAGQSCMQAWGPLGSPGQADAM